LEPDYLQSAQRGLRALFLRLAASNRFLCSSLPVSMALLVSLDPIVPKIGFCVKPGHVFAHPACARRRYKSAETRTRRTSHDAASAPAGAPFRSFVAFGRANSSPRRVAAA